MNTSERNINYSYMMNQWGNINFKKVTNFNEWFMGDFDDSYYFQDWDKVLRYHAGAGFKGIEIMIFTVPTMINCFGSMKNFKAFANERGIEKISGLFSHHIGSEDKRNHERIFALERQAVDALADCDGVNLIIQPCGQYYGTGPLSDEGLRNAAACMNEVGRMAADKGLVASIHNEFWCAVNKYDHEKFIDLCDPRYVFYCLDTAQVSIMGIDILEFYKKYHERVQYFHVKDTTKKAASDEERFQAGAESADDGTRWFWEPGAGFVDFPGLWKLMKQYGHKGWIGIESDGTPNPLATMLLTKNYIDTVLDPIYC
ncbi:MAG: sugar phosphate isomerase/epimerase [Oscillospiraceae bacterium]|nr:sugar phosphate isomerase/epimerase [Oscillospiraceae bacterium]